MTGNRAGRATVVTGTGQLGPTVFCAADSPSGEEVGMPDVFPRMNQEKHNQ